MSAALVRVGSNGTDPGRSLWLWCPGCDDAHRIVFDAPDRWIWDGSETTPTITPSIAVRYLVPSEPEKRCHSFVTAGYWHFLSDSTHALAWKTVPMVPLPDWLDDEYVTP